MRINMGWISKWRLYNYDVWGNAKDGYEVNDVFRTDSVYEIPNVFLDSDKELVKHLKREGLIKKSARMSHIEIDGDERTLYFSYSSRPEFELRFESKGGYKEI